MPFYNSIGESYKKSIDYIKNQLIKVKAIGLLNLSPLEQELAFAGVPASLNPAVNTLMDKVYDDSPIPSMHFLRGNGKSNGENMQSHRVNDYEITDLNNGTYSIAGNNNRGIAKHIVINPERVKTDLVNYIKHKLKQEGMGYTTSMINKFASFIKKNNDKKQKAKA